MHTCIKSKLIIIAAVAISALSSADPARAVILVYEGFGGYASGAMAGQAATGTGLTGNYASSTGTVNYSTIGLTFSDLSVTPGGIQVSASTATLGASLSASAAATGTLYASYLVNFSAAPSSNSSATIGVNQTPIQTGANRYFNMMADAGSSANTNAGFGYGENTTGDSGTTSLLGATTYMALVQINNVGVALSAGTTGTGSIWFLTAAQYDTFKVGGFDAAELNSATVDGTATGVSARYSTAVPVTSGTFRFNQTRALQLVMGPGAGVTYQFDEIRFGTSFADIAPVPEPGAGILALGGLAMLGFNRRRSMASPLVS